MPSGWRIPVFYPESALRATHPVPARADTPSASAARCHALRRDGGGAAGAVSATKRSIAAAIAAASALDGVGVINSIRGRGGRRFPLRVTCPNVDAHPAARRQTGAVIPVIDNDAVLAAVDARTAIDRTRAAFERHARGEWEMPAKVYLDSPPHGDFRAMPARGDGLALLKWVTSFPGNPERGLPVVAGAVVVSDAVSGELLAILDCRAVTWLRTGAAAAVSALALAREGAAGVGIIGCGVNGAWAARCLDAAGYGPGVCADVRAEAARSLADELGWEVGTREQAAAQDVVATVTPGDAPVVLAAELRPGQHLAVLGADAHGKAEVEPAAIERCRLFCDEWEQASGGGELAAAAAAGRVGRGNVVQLGDVLIGTADGRGSPDEITLFDSTGLAIQDLAIAGAALDAWREGRIEAETISL